MISIVIPTLNEEMTIKQIVEKCKNYGDEVLVVDGHSRDKTMEVVRDLGVEVILDN